ncbi:hypothetical protein [Kribbella sp. CA-293567]|uniref:hypothetical protein n=1 Tax=Kribbella sp. CA-293567 TaxID=3002436 RepID=UPI0022DDD3BC|nr:hypothetical protein [Kribbella sp. CA-293567]WBQ02495.1 hypothetical protein OX958_21175 [Kribbella sp. CA-293567]
MTATQPPAVALKFLTRAMLYPIPIITVMLWFVLAEDGFGELPGGWPMPVVAALAAGAFSYCELAGFRARPLGPGGLPAEVEKQSWLRFNSSTLLRFVACESVFVASIVIGFVVDSYWPVLAGGALTLGLAAWEVWPSLRNRRRFAAALEAAGHPSYLLGDRDLLGRTQDQL